MVSALLSGIILMSSAFIKSIEAFSLFFGICGGLSCGLLYFPSLSIVAQWFESRRALAVGLAICGSGVGTCLIAVLFSSAIQNFSWRGLLIIFGAVFFQLGVPIALFRPVEIQQFIDLEKSRRRAKERLRHLERDVLRREKHCQVATDQMQNQRRGANSRVGVIMSRILEEKFRQLTSSTGSLDGMVITRDNKLISLQTGFDHELVRETAVSSEGQASSHGHIGQLSSAPIQPRMRSFSVSDRSSANASQSKLPSPRPVLLLSPPREFSKSGVMRIADAILQKLEAQAVIAPGMRCPDMTSILRRRPSGLHGALTPEGSAELSPSNTGRQAHLQISAPHSESHPFNAVSGNRSKDPSMITNSTTMDISTKNFLCRPLPAMNGITNPTLYESDDSGKFGHDHLLRSDRNSPFALLEMDPVKKFPDMPSVNIIIAIVISAESMDALDVDTYLGLSPYSRSTSHSFSGGDNSSIDPRTDRAIASELSRVALDSTVKARIRTVIYRELKRQKNTTLEDHQTHISKADVGDFPQTVTHSTPEGSSTEAEINQGGIIVGDPNCCPSCGHVTNTRPLTTSASRCGLPGEPPYNRRVPLALLIDALDLQLLRSPSFLMFSLACTLHMFAFYIERIVSEPKFLQDYENEGDDDSEIVLRLSRRVMHAVLNKLADPMILNMVSLVIGGICLLCIPLTTYQVGAPQQIPSCSSLAFLRGIFFALIFLHTLFSALAISLRSAIAVQLIGVHHLTSAFVYLLVFQGTGAIVGPILLGENLKNKSSTNFTSVQSSL
ncbi:hypothetical protein Aperf_G00000077704 [Anoplocephala perfoliata]